jgi:hypothetical protein
MVLVQSAAWTTRRPLHSVFTTGPVLHAQPPPVTAAYHKLAGRRVGRPALPTVSRRRLGRNVQPTPGDHTSRRYMLFVSADRRCGNRCAVQMHRSVPSVSVKSARRVGSAPQDLASPCSAHFSFLRSWPRAARRCASASASYGAALTRLQAPSARARDGLRCDQHQLNYRRCGWRSARPDHRPSARSTSPPPPGSRRASTAAPRIVRRAELEHCGP